MIAVIIVGYNSQPFLKACFDSLYRSTLTDFKIIFVDNKSSDQSLELIAKSYPKVTVIANPANYGFAKANNLGIKAAMNEGAEAVFLLNPDTVVAPDCLQLLSQELDPQTILQPLILLDPVKKTEQINTTGGVLSILGFSYCSDYRLAATQATTKERPIASGAAMLLPVALLQKIGLFDELFFMYHEDVDLTWRARLAGYATKLIPEARVWHDYSFNRNPRKFYQVERNRLIFLLKNFSLSYWLLLLPLFLITELAICFYLLKDGLLGAKLKSYGSILQNWSAIQNGRATTQKIRRQSDKKLAHWLSDQVQFSEIAIPLLKPYNMFVRIYWRLISSLL